MDRIICKVLPRINVFLVGRVEEAGGTLTLQQTILFYHQKPPSVYLWTNTAQFTVPAMESPQSSNCETRSSPISQAGQSHSFPSSFSQV